MEAILILMDTLIRTMITIMKLPITLIISLRLMFIHTHLLHHLCRQVPIPIYIVTPIHIPIHQTVMTRILI
jgi:hypothetical protein